MVSCTWFIYGKLTLSDFVKKKIDMIFRACLLCESFGIQIKQNYLLNWICNYSFGYNYSWGVYLAFYKSEVYIGQMSTLSWIGSICVALFFIIGPFNQLIIERMGYKYMLATGTVCCTAALILASFAKEV